MTAMRRRGAHALVLDTLHAHRVSLLAWALGGALTMFGMVLSVGAEYRSFPGGREALAASITASAEAMRALRWPAERLDTLGGYLTYHNVTLFNFMLALYGAVLGARVVRGAEERHSLEEVLATGRARWAVVLDRTLGVLALATVVALALGLGISVGLAVEGEANTAGALGATLTAGLLLLCGYGLGLTLSQLTTSARPASGLSAGVLTVLYVLTNVSDKLPAGEVVQYGSPFWWALQSRPLVPGGRLDLLATLVLLASAAALVAVGALAFQRRDYLRSLFARKTRNGRRATHVPRALVGAMWAATLRRARWSLVAWTAGAAGLTALMAWLEPAVMKVWEAFPFIAAMTGGVGVTPERAYWSFAGELVTPVLAAWALVRASSWVSELSEGRVELWLSTPLSWRRLVLERLIALTVGAGLISAGALLGLALGAWAVGGTIEFAGLARLWVTGVLFGAALGAVGALAVVTLRRASAVTVLAVVLGASYLLAYFVPLFGWPDWLNRLSVFWAFGHPYREWPTWSALAVLLVLAVPGALGAALIAERTPKVA
ncbi:MAG: ABC transporter permease subunit [Myxococcota bacterium]